MTTVIIIRVETIWPTAPAEADQALTRIVLPLDGSQLARAAIGPAVELARRSGARLELLTTTVAEGPAEPTSFLDEIADAIDGIELRTTTRIERDPVQAIEAALTEGGGSGLVVMSSHGRGRVGRAVLGSTSELVVALGSAPAVVVGPSFRPDTFNPDGPLLVAHDGDHEPDLEFIAMIAKTTGGQVTVLEVTFSPVKSLSRHRVATAGSAAANACAGRLREMGFEVATEVRQGAQAHKVIVDEAERIGASYAAITSRANTGARRAALGSVAAGVVKSSPIPVLISRARHRQTDEQPAAVQAGAAIDSPLPSSPDKS